MKTIKGLIALLAICCTAVSCEKDGDKIILSGLEPSKLIATAYPATVWHSTPKQP